MARTCLGGNRAGRSATGGRSGRYDEVNDVALLNSALENGRPSVLPFHFVDPDPPRTGAPHAATALGRDGRVSGDTVDRKLLTHECAALSADEHPNISVCYFDHSPNGHPVLAKARAAGCGEGCRAGQQKPDDGDGTSCLMKTHLVVPFGHFVAVWPETSRPPVG